MIGEDNFPLTGSCDKMGGAGKDLSIEGEGGVTMTSSSDVSEAFLFLMAPAEILSGGGGWDSPPRVGRGKGGKTGTRVCWYRVVAVVTWCWVPKELMSICTLARILSRPAATLACSLTILFFETLWSEILEDLYLLVVWEGGADEFLFSETL